MNEAGVIWHATLLGFAIMMSWAAYDDARSFKIPNKLPLGIALLYPAFVISAPFAVDWTGALAVAAILLLVGFVMFICRLLGAGDAKLLAAASLWVGPALLLDFLLVTALAGGGIAVVMWLQHRVSRAAVLGEIFSRPIDQDFGKRPMPYGVALCLGGLYTAFTIVGLR
jgi:prepilin peptidase CpaA